MTNLEQALQNGFCEFESSSNKVAFFFGEDSGIIFDIRKKVPGVIKHHGFHPTCLKIVFHGGARESFWAIDEHGQCWTNGNTGTLNVGPVDAEKLLGNVEAWEARNNIRGFLGMKLELPPWAREALKNGWEMPASFPVALYNMEGIEV